jgi:hydrogenase maturation protease
VRIVALGHPDAGDDAIALRVLDELAAPAGGSLELELVRAGRPGVGLLDLLETDRPVVIVDVLSTGAAPGTVRALELRDAADAAISGARASSHDFGPADVLRLAGVLGRTLPRGRVVGVEGARFERGAGLSWEVAGSIAALRDAVLRAAHELAAETEG